MKQAKDKVTKDRLNLSSSLATKIRSVYPNINDYMRKRDGIDLLSSAKKFWGNEVIQFAIQENVLIKVVLVKKHKNNLEPDKRLEAVHLPDWNRAKPSWWDNI